MTMKANVSQLKVADNTDDERFPFIFQNMPVEGQQDLVTFELTKIDKESPNFDDCETFIDLGFSGLVAYWKPQTMLNLLEFINENKPAKRAEKQPAANESDKLDRDLDDRINFQGPEESKGDNNDLQRQSAAVQRHKGCLDKPSFLIKVSVNLAYLKSVFIHPDNNSYPIFSIIVQETGVDYWKKCDHDQLNLRVRNLQVFDNTSYPDTLNPTENYSKDVEVNNREILGLNTGRE